MQPLVTTLGLLTSLSLLPGDGDSLRLRWTDADGDGHRDAFVVAADGRVHLLLADAHGVLRPADAGWGLSGLRDVLGVTASGHELLVLHRGRGPSLLVREGETFVDRTLGSGLEHAGDLTGATFVDWDADGVVDVEARRATGEPVLFRGEGDGRYRAQELPFAAPLLPGEGFPVVSTGATEADAGAANVGATTADRAPTPSAVRGVRALPDAGTRSPASRGASGVSVIEKLAVSGACAQSLRDQATGGCVQASSSPQSGALLPLGPLFFVDPSGNVGLGTESPSADLHVVGRTGSMRLGLGSPVPAFSQLQMSTQGDFVEGMRLKADESGFGVSAWTEDRGTVGMFGPHLFVKKGLGAQVGIGTDDPESVLHVDGRTFIDAPDAVPALVLRSTAGTPTMNLTPAESAGEGGVFTMQQADGATTFKLDAEYYAGARLSMYDSDGTETVDIRSEELLGNGGRLSLRKGDGTESIKLDANIGGIGVITTDVLNITGGSDLVEGFDVRGEACEPGSVVVIDGERTGELTLSGQPYDRRVAGVVSGAGGVRPGLRLGQAGVLDGDTPVALSGRVYVRCSVEGGAIRAGDLLTTSSAPGVAMRASDSERSNGAVLGKAMGALEDGEGLVLVLVNLQ